MKHYFGILAQSPLVTPWYFKVDIVPWVQVGTSWHEWQDDMIDEDKIDKWLIENTVDFQIFKSWILAALIL